MKRIISLIIAVLMLASISVSATTVEFIIGDTTMATVLNNTADRQLTTSPLLAAPFIANDRTMVPVRALAQSFNCQVSWDPEFREVKVVGNNREILLYIDSTTAYVNGVEVTLDAAPVIVGDITFIPVRFVTENMGYNVAFIPGINSVLIYDQPDKTNIYGDPILFPAADIFNYGTAMSYGVHPAETDDKDYINYSEFILNMYDYFSNYMANNSLDFPEELMVGKSEIDTAYSANMLKGELLLYRSMVGAENVTIAHLAEANAEEIIAYYKNEYTCAKHILISNENRSDEEAAAIAEEVYTALMNGEDFDTLLSMHNEDPGMAQNPDGYVFTKGEMVKEFETAAFALTPGEMSSPVKTAYGYHIILGEELPEISKNIILNCISKLYITPVMQTINDALNG